MVKTVKGAITVRDLLATSQQVSSLSQEELSVQTLDRYIALADRLITLSSKAEGIVSKFAPVVMQQFGSTGMSKGENWTPMAAPAINVRDIPALPPPPPPTPAPTESPTMKTNVEQIVQGLDMLLAMKPDMTVAEAKQMIIERKDELNKILGLM
jgi:hypothetical protein